MSRSRFAAVCCAALIACTAPQAAALNQVSFWAEPEVNKAISLGLEPASLSNANASTPITRAEFCSLVLSLYESRQGILLPRTENVYFSDCSDPAVNTAYELKLVNGTGNGRFTPDATVTRQDLCVMLQNTLKALGLIPEGDSSLLNDFTDRGSISAYARDAVSSMLARKVICGTGAALNPLGTASREQALIMTCRTLESCRVFTDAPPVFAIVPGEIIMPIAPAPAPQPEDPEPTAEPEETDSAANDETDSASNSPIDSEQLFWNLYGQLFDSPEDFDDTDSKMTLVFGEGGAYYEDESTARANQTTIEVPVWRLSSDGKKTSGKASLTVHKNLAPIVSEIFKEIYEGDEQFPIANVGGWAWRSSTRSEHRQGTAIDINWEQNMEATRNGDGTLTVTSGDHWTPGEDPYSIPADGDVVRAFKSHGFSWGGDAWSSKVDYMHFSYFGH